MWICRLLGKHMLHSRLMNKASCGNTFMVHLLPMSLCSIDQRLVPPFVYTAKHWIPSVIACGSVQPRHTSGTRSRQMLSWSWNNCPGLSLNMVGLCVHLWQMHGFATWRTSRSVFHFSCLALLRPSWTCSPMDHACFRGNVPTVLPVGLLCWLPRLGSVCAALSTFLSQPNHFLAFFKQRTVRSLPQSSQPSSLPCGPMPLSVFGLTVKVPFVHTKST